MSKIIDDIKTINNINIFGTTQSTNTISGALIISGGVGITKNVNIGGNLLMTGDFQLKSNTTDSGIITFNTPADDVINYTITWPRTQGTLDQMLLNDGNGNLVWSDFPESATTGSLTVSGETSLDTLDTSGAATMGSTLNVADNTTLGGNLTIGDDTKINGTTQSVSCTTGALTVAGGLGVTKNIFGCGDLNLTGAIVSGTSILNDTTQSTSTSTGSLKVAGGVGIGKNLSMSGDLQLNSSSTNGGAITFNSSSVSTTGYTLVFPHEQGSNNQAMLNDGSGNLFWTTVVTSAVGVGNAFGTDNRMLRTFGTGNDIEATGITISDTNGISGISSINVSGNSTLSGSLIITDTTQSTSTNNGALVVTGGAGIYKGLTLGGKLALNIRTTTEDSDLGDDYILNVESTSSATITLPDITDDQYNGVTYLIIKNNSNTVNLTTQSSDKIVDEGTDADTITLDGAAGERIHVVSNGLKWYII